MGNKVQVTYPPLTATGVTVPSFSFCVFETRGSQYGSLTEGISAKSRGGGVYSPLNPKLIFISFSPAVTVLGAGVGISDLLLQKRETGGRCRWKS